MLINNTPLTVEEELFCTRYELEILSGIVNLGMLERWLPGFCGAHTHKEHASRYNWVKGFVKNKTVLDIACGTGFGSFEMATDGNATCVTACDIDTKTVKYASYRNRHPLIDFHVQNAEAFTFDKKFDVITSFETIEHLGNPEIFLENINQVLNKNGSFFVSTPISAVPQNNNPVNIYHAVEWGFEKFQGFVSKYFQIEDILLQVYQHPAKPKNALMARALRKAGIIKKSNNQTIIEKLVPFSWEPEEINKEIIGTIYTGYQILQCKKK
jgi:2-polyprenyl-3-methyl-5-hydroxy-6-metoxy-1,4-benzoquinol methylase